MSCSRLLLVPFQEAFTQLFIYRCFTRQYRNRVLLNNWG